MPRKKKSSNSLSTSPTQPDQKSEELMKNLKAKNSDENLTSTTTAVAIEPEKIRKRSMVSLPTEGEEDDEFLFIRLRKQIKGHWDKIMENGNMFFRPHHNNQNTAAAHETEINRTDSVKTTTTTTSTNTSSSSTTTNTPVENNLISSSIKSVFLLPAFSCNRDDEGRKVVPFISSLLQVNQ